MTYFQHITYIKKNLLSFMSTSFFGLKGLCYIATPFQGNMRKRLYITVTNLNHL
jgi:hypothetical protein